MKTLLAAAAVMLMAGCATHQSSRTDPVDGERVTVRGQDVEYLRSKSNPSDMQKLDEKGPAPRIWEQIIFPACKVRSDVRKFPDRVYWMIRGLPSANGFSDEQLALVAVNDCKRLIAAGKWD